MNDKHSFRVGLTMGDPAGIGPEIAAKALVHHEFPDTITPVVIGGSGVLHRGAETIGITAKELDTIEIITPEGSDPPHYQVGVIQASCGEAAFNALITAIDLARKGEIDAVVTGPLHKQALHLAGHHYPGHTEILAEQCGGVEVALMLIAGQFRVAHVTCHNALMDVRSLLTHDRIVRVAQLFNDALLALDKRQPRMALCALNPHGGEGGLFGREEIEILLPAVQTCREKGMQISEPLPSDSIYPRQRAGEFDGVIALYHDQGHIAFKLINFQVDTVTGRWTEVCGVNVTLGLPIIRTSVDHGTAFDIAGNGIASERSLLDAIETAAKLVPLRRR